MTDFTILTFVTRNHDGSVNFWAPERPDSYGAATAMGREYAAELREFMQVTGCSEVFGTVMRAITRGGVYGGVETGFCSQFGIMLAGITAPRKAPTRPVRATA